MLAKKIRELTAKGFSVIFYEATGAESPQAETQPYMTMEVARRDTKEVFGADFRKTPTDAEVLAELHSLLDLHELLAAKRQRQSTETTSSAA